MSCYDCSSVLTEDEEDRRTAYACAKGHNGDYLNCPDYDGFDTPIPDGVLVEDDDIPF